MISRFSYWKWFKLPRIFTLLDTFTFACVVIQIDKTVKWVFFFIEI